MKKHGVYKMGEAARYALVNSGALKVPGLMIEDFCAALGESLLQTEVHIGDSRKSKKKLRDGLERARDLFRSAHHTGNKVIFIGNGGSAAIASHMATDYTKNGGIRSIAFNDAPTLTCMANDFGYENAMTKLVEYYARPNDVVVCISSSGMSENILNAAAEAMTRDLQLVTLSGFQPENHLRGMGDVNFWVPAADYGLIEITHLTILHSITTLTQF